MYYQGLIHLLIKSFYRPGKCNKIEIKSDQKLLNKESFDRLKKEIGLLNV